MGSRDAVPRPGRRGIQGPPRLPTQAEPRESGLARAPTPQKAQSGSGGRTLTRAKRRENPEARPGSPQEELSNGHSHATEGSIRTKDPRACKGPCGSTGTLLQQCSSPRGGCYTPRVCGEPGCAATKARKSKKLSGDASLIQSRAPLVSAGHARRAAQNQMGSLLSRSSGPGGRRQAERALRTGPALAPALLMLHLQLIKGCEAREEGHLILKKNTDEDKMADVKIISTSNRKKSKDKT